jgi:hypothetical protein
MNLGQTNDTACDMSREALENEESPLPISCGRKMTRPCCRKKRDIVEWH